MSKKAIILVISAGAVIGLTVTIVMIGAGIAKPALGQARLKANEASARASLMAIRSGEMMFASSCGEGGHAVSLEDLAKPPAGASETFVPPDLSRNGAEKSGYRFKVEKDGAASETVTAAGKTCNGSTSDAANGFFASAEPVTPGSSGTLYFATDSSGAVFESDKPIANPIVASSAVRPVQ